MFQIIASLLILLNPAIGFFMPEKINSGYQISRNENNSDQESLSFNLNNYKLPLPENAFLASQFIPTYPMRDWSIPPPEISAKIALVFDVSRQKILWQKDGLHETRPIASLTKLATALIVMENAEMNDIFTISKNAVQTPGELGGLIVGEQLIVENLLYALLVESSNDAAVALAENISQKLAPDFSLFQKRSTDSSNNSLPPEQRPSGNKAVIQEYELFINLMNQKARALGLADTKFTDPSGLDPGNQSSAWDMNIIMQEFLKYPTLRKISQTPAFDFISADEKFNHHLTGTNKLLGKFPEIIAGKTGYTEEAGNCMVLAWQAPGNQGIIVSIIMDSQDRMSESETLIKWTKEAFLW